jgi:TonB family protein
MSKPGLALAVIILSFNLPPLFPRCSAQEIPEVGKVADRIAQKLNGKKKEKVLVIDFPFADGALTALGQTLSDQLSAALIQRISANNVVERTQLAASLRDNGLSPADLRDRDIASWLGRETGANSIVIGSLVAREGNFILTLELFRIGDSKRVFEAVVNIPRTDQIADLAEKPVNWPPPPDVAVTCLTPAHTSESAAVFKAAGVTLPGCSYCPQPSYTDAARSAKYQGTAKFNVVVDENGRASSISLVDPGGHALDVEAIKVIRTWRFKPAIKEGKPVAVCVLIEVSFHLY